ncbi:helix-turn-helix protein [Amycolatopsis echigonensis]|uniref:Helix-turn-helix protein n=1 Tax=Amycolatopsis echigonensis TaxID=2576905 RepID=A0A2N3WU95_9PSEU|nr:helix-turn-helix transcriptional regulator [Amycolatopsis niigatensis]PKV97442.1 helix-turn-helix protein [Amycolatopsis niigatensis]
MDNLLGDFLRARRERVAPADVGLPDNGRRRVRGLRREELALLAGISSDYYIRLEQGRDQNPSAQVLDALARALGLDEASRRHLHQLAGPPPPGQAEPQAPASIVELISTWATNPAYVQDRLTNVLAANPIAAAVSPNYAVGRNLLRAIFLDPAERELRRDWDQMAADGVAGLRAALGPDIADPAAAELIAGLTASSSQFRELWAQHDVKPRTGHLVRFRHPAVGNLDLHSDKLDIPGPAPLQLVVFHATPGTRDAEALASLADLAPAR